MDESKVIELYRKYDNCRQVAEILGTNNEAVRRVLIRNGIKRTGNRLKHEPKFHMPSNCNKKYCNAVVVMLRENLGLTTSEIREETGIPSDSVAGIIRRKRPDLQLAKCQRIKTDIIDAIERDYATGASTITLGEKYGIHPATVSCLMRKRGHMRGKGGGALIIANEKRRRKALEKIIAECGSVENIEALSHDAKRELLMANRRRDYGITWKSLARRNGSMRCEVCGIECDPNDKSWGSSGPTHPSVDHIVRICDGGEDTWENSRLACMRCNLRLNAEANRIRKGVCA